ncbi:cupin domain-containing protein [Gramella sp. MT6]|uniref:cupin domain-containing protein n=1 Tax=Gramella sp. MT6 TaxID=2705471 RepID=UPI001C604C29|nr:cupin domain-containing protein [Gramella sp. MT6]QYA26480.1 cupin domain-containing protein [Gramella sp. MT6]
MQSYLKSSGLKRSVLILLLIFFSTYTFAQDAMKNENSVAINLKDGNIKWGACPDLIPNGCQVTVLNGDITLNNADVLFRFEPNTDIPEHWHNSAERMILLQGELEVTYEGEETRILKEGFYAYGPEKKAHNARCSGGEPCLLFVAFEKPVDAFAGKSN